MDIKKQIEEYCIARLTGNHHILAKGFMENPSLHPDYKKHIYKIATAKHSPCPLAMDSLLPEPQVDWCGEWALDSLGPIEGIDYVVDSQGVKRDPVTLLELESDAPKKLSMKGTF